MRTDVRSAVAGLVLTWAACAAQAQCSRPIQVPLAAVGLSIDFEGKQASGVYPALLREVAANTRCEMVVRKVPRARQQSLFDAGQADLLLPASATPARDAKAEFVPLVQVRVSLLTLDREGAVPHSLAELLAQPNFKLAVVRGFSFGPAYDDAIAALRRQHRLIEEAELSGVARALRQGIAQGTVMTATILVGALAKDQELMPLLQRLRVEPLEELGWNTSGLYLSLRSLNDTDRRTLRQGLDKAARGERVWQLFNEHYPPGSLGGSVKPLGR